MGNSGTNKKIKLRTMGGTTTTSVTTTPNTQHVTNYKFDHQFTQTLSDSRQQSPPTLPDSTKLWAETAQQPQLAETTTYGPQR